MAKSKYIYVQSPAKFAEFWSKISNVGRPARADKEWLARLGFAHSNDITMLSLVQALGYVDEENVPTDRWASLRSAELSKKVLAEAIREHYADLYSMFPNAHDLDAAQLHDFFRADTEVGPTAIRLILSTFRTLSSLAGLTDFQPGRTQRSDQPKQPTAKAAAAKPTTTQAAPAPTPAPVTEMANLPLGVHINIELHLPATSDAEVYDKLFAALRKHLLAS